MRGVTFWPLRQQLRLMFLYSMLTEYHESSVDFMKTIWKERLRAIHLHI